MQIENLQEQLKDKEKQMTSLKERVKSLQTDTSNTDTALTTLEEALSEKVDTPSHTHTHSHSHLHSHINLQPLKFINVLLSSLVVCFRVVTVATFSLVWLSPMECSKRPSLSYTLANWTDIAQILLLLLFIIFLLILIFCIYWNWSTGAVFLSSMLCL